MGELKTRADRLRRTATFFLLPAALVLTFVTLGPLIYSLFVSFTNWTLTVPGSENELVGFANYHGVISNFAFWRAVQVTLTFGVTSTLLELILGVILALMLNQEFLGRGIVRALVLIPLVITPAVIGMFWRLLYDDQQGVLNYFLLSLGLPRLHWLDHGLALPSLVLTDVWQWTPFLVLIVLAGLQSRDVDMLDAARIDGANAPQIFRYLTLPHLFPYLLVGLFFRLLDAMKEFDKIYLLTQGGPGNETTTVSVFAFNTGFRIFEIGKTSAIAWIVAAVSLVVSLPLLWAMRRRLMKEAT
ncbi:MAG: multiple sugar transport system permease protein [Verrucomicrobiota bacterium]|jgi:ABC-type sugar transport system permease subunit|nr:multiple sugar transport system permease protein [Verrucomicrobiota bacterium]MEA3163642.1 multiple sugar transport system permease protein [Verrucomicrobiota bacterium]